MTAAPILRAAPTPDPDDSGSHTPSDRLPIASASGWRAGRPVEDPEKTKPWGFITAKPSEYLIHVRRGKIRRRTTGQGASCFKWPWDSVAVVPTTINRLQFAADQVTREKVGVEVAGLAVYRIVAPEVTFRMLNFSFGERASLKLAEILGEMLVGATRRLVANLTVEEAMTHRKSAIAAELMAELGPVLEGSGREDDTTVCGWGVVLDTVEIQNVRVLSNRVFANMQARYRADLATQARQAELDSERAIAAREADSKREIEMARLESDRATREMRATAETKAAQIEATETTRREAMMAKVAEDRIARDRAQRLSQASSDAEIEADTKRREEAAALEAVARQRRLDAAQAELEAQRHEQQTAEAIDAVARQRRVAAAEAELAAQRHEEVVTENEREAALREQKQRAMTALRELTSVANEIITRREVALRRLEGEVDNVLAEDRRRIENLVSEESIRLSMVEKALPALAANLAPEIGQLNVTSMGEGGIDPTSMVMTGVSQLLTLARSLGVSVDRAD